MTKNKGILLVLLLILICSCNIKDANSKLIKEDDDQEIEYSHNKADSSTIFVAISSMTSPKETYYYYNELLKYFSHKTGKNIKLKQRKTYTETNELIKTKEVDFAFICTGAYIKGGRDERFKLLAVPVIDGKPTYQAYIVANKNTNINKFEDLKGHSFAFTDPLSNTGNLYPQKRLKELNLSAESFFSRTIFTYGHDISIELVNKGVFDAASIDGLIFEYLANFDPNKINDIIIIEKSPEYGMPPIVVPKNLSDSIYHGYQNIFLNMHQDEDGKEILSKLRIDKFISVGDSLYDSALKLIDIDHAEN